MNKDFFEFIELCLVDGTINEKKKKVIYNKGKHLGIDDEECEVILDAFIYKRNISEVTSDTNDQEATENESQSEVIEIVKEENIMRTDYLDEILSSQSPIHEKSNDTLYLKETGQKTEVYTEQDATKHPEILLNPENLDLKPFEDNSLEGWGYIDPLSSEVVIPPIYNYATVFLNGAAIVELNDGFTLIDQNGNEKTEIRFENIIHMFEDIYKAKISSKYVLLDSDGELLTDLQYDIIDDFKNDISKVKYKSKYGLINSGGGIIVESKYEEIDITYYNGNYIAKVKIDDKLGVYNSRKMIIPCEYDKIDIIGDDSIIVIKGNDTSCFDRLGKDTTLVDINLEKYLKEKINKNPTLLIPRGKLTLTEIVKIFFFHLFFGIGFFYVDKSAQRKYLYPTFGLYALLDIILGPILEIEPFKGDFGGYTFLISLVVCYIIGYIDLYYHRYKISKE